MNVVVNGLMTNYTQNGNGKLIVLLHGWGDSSLTFTELIRHLHGKFTILALDLPGFGGTEPPPKAWGLSDYAEFVGAWLKKINAGHVYALIGHSFGGSIAIVGVSEEQIKADKVVLIASGGIRKKNFVKKKTLQITAKTLKLPLLMLSQRKADRLKAGLYKKVGSDLLLIPHMRQTFVKMVREDVQLAALSIKQPTLIIYGERDTDTPVEYGRLLNQAIRNSRLVLIPGMGHFLHQEQPAAVSKLISNFLEESQK